jgi:hypothetical protein
LKNRLVVFILLIICGCAIRENPKGGPVDKESPEVVYTFPQADSTGIKAIIKIEIHFSERMNKSAVENALFISPPLDFEKDWSGWDELTLELSDTLAANQTYVVTLAVSAEDINRNRLGESYQFAFSTGDQIDKGQIPGRVVGLKKNESFYIYAFRCDDPDSLNPTLTKADFLTMPDDKGNFQLKYLAFDMYRIFAVEDINRNLLLDAGIERIGIPWCDVVLDSISPVAPHMTFMLTKIDTTPPVLIDARSLNHRTAMVRFSEPLANLTRDMIMIKDTLNGKPLDIMAFYQESESDNQYVFLTALHDSTTGYEVIAEEIADSSGNKQMEKQAGYFPGSALVDTMQFNLVTVSPADSLTNISITAPITLEFSIPVDTGSVAQSLILFSARGDTLNASWTWDDLKKGKLITGERFLPGKTYLFQVSMGSIYSVWGDRLADSSFTNTYFVISEDEFGSISGKYLGDPVQNVYIQAIPLQSKQPQVLARVKSNGEYVFEWLLDGKYKIAGYLDKDDDGFHSRGNLLPFHFAEPYHIMDDTVRVKKRFEKASVNFRIPGVE